MGGGKGGGLSDSVQAGMLQNETALVNIAQQQSANAQQLYKTTEPGLATAENFYSALASGDPSAIMRAIGPATEQIQQASQGATKSIMETAPAGGEKNLALEEVQAQKGAAVGDVASKAYLQAPNALAGLAGQGVGESISAAGAGISGLSAASSDLSNLGGLQIENAQLQAQQKGASLGGLGSLLGMGASVGASQVGGFSFGDALTALAAF
jgi:hypothetical protein